MGRKRRCSNASSAASNTSVLEIVRQLALVLPAPSLGVGHHLGLAAWSGRSYLFTNMVPKSFLPVGDSSFMLGVMIAQQGSSPQQMRAYQGQVEKAMQANPDVRLTITATGLNFPGLNSNMGFCIAFLYLPEERKTAPAPGDGKYASIQTVQADLQKRIMMSTTGVIAVLPPQPVLQISTGATNRQDRFDFVQPFGC